MSDLEQNDTKENKWFSGSVFQGFYVVWTFLLRVLAAKFLWFLKQHSQQKGSHHMKDHEKRENLVKKMLNFLCTILIQVT